MCEKLVYLYSCILFQLSLRSEQCYRTLCNRRLYHFTIFTVNVFRNCVICFSVKDNILLSPRADLISGFYTSSVSFWCLPSNAMPLWTYLRVFWHYLRKYAVRFSPLYSIYFVVSVKLFSLKACFFIISMHVWFFSSTTEYLLLASVIIKDLTFNIIIIIIMLSISHFWLMF